MLKDFVSIISKFIGSGFEIIRLVSSANKTILLFLFIECGKSFIYIEGKARGQVSIPDEHHGSPHPNLR